MVISEEDCSLARRILRDLRIIFEREPNLLEFDIIPVEEKICNKSPVILQEHRLALESWSTKHLYQYTYNQFIESPKNNRKDKASLLEWTRCLLLINPDLTTAWNCRKELVLYGYITISDELKFSELVLKRRHKAPENFAHRQWLICRLVQSSPILDDDVIDNELLLCYEAADRYQSNYYAWNHRRWIINKFRSGIDICIYELETNKAWLEKHTSDYSGFSYRQFILQRICQLLEKSINCRSDENISSIQLFITEMDFINNLLNIHQNRESLFLHRRYVLSRLKDLCPDQEEELICQEIEFVNQHSYSAFLRQRHVFWCSNVLKWDILGKFKG